MKIEGMLALVTGATQGIGAATVTALLKAGAGKIILVSRNRSLTHSDDGTLHWRSVDVSKHEEVANLANWIKKQFQKFPDIIVNAAGSGRFRFIDESSRSDIEEPMNVRYFGTVNIIAAFLPEMLWRKTGHIVNLTSPAAIAPFPGATSYAASCGAVYTFSKALRQDLRQTGVNTTLMIPSLVGDTAYFNKDPDSRQRLPGLAKLIPVLSADKVAARIVRAIKREERQVFMPGMLRFFYWLHRLGPGPMEYLIWKTGRKR